MAPLERFPAAGDEDFVPNRETRGQLWQQSYQLEICSAVRCYISDGDPIGVGRVSPDLDEQPAPALRLGSTTAPRGTTIGAWALTTSSVRPSSWNQTTWRYRAPVRMPGDQSGR